MRKEQCHNASQTAQWYTAFEFINSRDQVQGTLPPVTLSTVETPMPLRPVPTVLAGPCEYLS